MTWPRAILLPSREDDLSWGGPPILGLPLLVRLLIALRRAGVEEVALPPQALAEKERLERWSLSRSLPILHWDGGAAWTGEARSSAPLLCVRWGTLFGPSLVSWFGRALDGEPSGTAAACESGAPPALLSLGPEVPLPASPAGSFEEIAAHLPGPVLAPPPGTFCVETAGELPEERQLLDTVGKATDRWHVRWVRRWSFPLLRMAVRRGLSPNQITVAGFVVALAGALLIASGSYLGGVAGALVLYFSWVLDCIDGTLARVTYAESEFGRRLDTVTGHLSNLMIFGALIYAVYGEGPLWAAVLLSLLILGGITVAFSVTGRAVRTSGEKKSARPGLQSFLDKANHRDYAVWVFLFALFDAFPLLLWASAVGVQVFWMTQYLLNRTSRQEGAASSSR